MDSTQDWFMMTGDLIINLRNTKTGDAFNLNQNGKEKILNNNNIHNKNAKSHIKNGDNHLETDLSQEQAQLKVNGLSRNHKNFHRPDADSLQQNESNVDTHNGWNNDTVIQSDSLQRSLQQEANKLTLSANSNSSSGNSSGTTDEDLSNSQSYSDSLASSPSKPYNNGSSNADKYFSEDFGYYYESYNDKQNENCYENIGECRYLNKSNESNLYNLIDDSKSLDNLSTDSDNSSVTSFNYSSTRHQCIDVPSASRLAKRLYNLEGFQKSDVTRHLSKNNEFSRAVAEEYLRLFDFSAQALDDALRLFLSRFYLTGETQERERVLVYFSKRYYECNSDVNFKSIDSIHTLVCALMLLNTDLHEENIQRKMTCSDFIINLSGMNDGDQYSADLLKYLYYSIKNNPLGWNEDDLDGVRKDRNVFSKITTISKSISSPYATLPRKYNSLCSNPFVEVPNPKFAIEYKKGYIRRKCCYDSNGKRTPIGRRGWKLFYATLHDLVLYLHKDENGFRKSQLQESFANSIRIHHSIASVAIDYPKKKFVFRLINADYAEYLFETSDSRELQSWVDTINTTAASLSAPTLPMAVSSDNYKFKREIFPVSHTKMSLRDQLKDQENKLLSLQKELEILLEKSGKNSTNRSFQKEFAEKENYLQHEVKRYRVYITCLKWKLQQADKQSCNHEYQSNPNDCLSLHKSTITSSDTESNTS